MMILVKKSLETVNATMYSPCCNGWTTLGRVPPSQPAVQPLGNEITEKKYYFLYSRLL